jgi:hypothetical protein
MTKALDPNALDHLCKLLGMLGSRHDGEIAAAGRKATEFLKRLGLQWCDVIHPLPETPVAARPYVRTWREMVHACLAAEVMLKPKERQFLHTLTTWRGDPTPKQMAWLVRIYEALS